MGLNIDWQRAHRYALASQAVYGSEDEAKAWAKTHLEADETVFLSRGNTQLIIAENLSELSIIYRGSQQFGDWIANMKIRKTRRPYGRVHRGFMSAFLDVEAEVMGVIERARRLGKDIYLAGHSLGGALAVITAAEAQSKFGMMKLKGVFTYGMPRTCDAACAEHMTRIFGPIHTRFVNHRDLVTRIPPFSYHTGRLVHFDHSGEIEILDEEVLSLEFDGTEETALSASEFELLQEALSLKDVQAEGQITGASDHAIQNYIDLFAARVRL
jgi:triacylglycerol lipase